MYSIRIGERFFNVRDSIGLAAAVNEKLREGEQNIVVVFKEENPYTYVGDAANSSVKNMDSVMVKPHKVSVIDIPNEIGVSDTSILVYSAVK